MQKDHSEILDVPTGPIVSVCIAAAASICEDNDNNRGERIIRYSNSIRIVEAEY